MDQFTQQVRQGLVPSQLSTDPLRLLAYGSDASFYRLIPKLVVHLQSEADVRRILPLANAHKVPVTFRAAGTSLSGQAITDSVLLKLSAESWKQHRVIHSAEQRASHILVQPGLIGGEVNRLLAPHHRKIGPDPSSIDSCMIGGIVANNSSGMCCGTAENSYNTISDVRLVFADGAVLDTADPDSVEQFRKSHGRLVQGISDIRERIQQSSALREKIVRKFRLKCTSGYSLNAFVDYEDPIDIIKHLMVGSEGTLGFLSNVTLRTLPDHPIKQTSLVLFPDFYQACDAAAILKETGVVNAAEIMDRASLRSAEVESAAAGNTGHPALDQVMQRFVDTVKCLDDNAAALLLEIRSDTEGELDDKVARVTSALRDSDKEIKTMQEISFTRDPVVSKYYWDIRKGLIPLVGGNRAKGSSYLMEDVATDVEQLAPMGMDIKHIFQRYEYHDATLFGHALDGNFHLAFSQDFNVQADIDRYRYAMDELCELVANKYDGSLKAEHGTGRNMAPFMEMEWGSEAYQIMWDIKALFDPHSIMNPGVVLNRNPTVHIENLKPMPVAHPAIDKCIECGFCESVCPSRNVTITPRQRIVAFREIARLKDSGEDPARLHELEKLYQYDGFDTCAADGMCAEKCPVGINTGTFVKDMRRRQASRLAEGASMAIAKHFPAALEAGRLLLSGAHAARSLLGEAALVGANQLARAVTPRGTVPQWNKYFPLAAASADPPAPVGGTRKEKVVYFSSCVARLMGPSAGDHYNQSVAEVTRELLTKAKYEIITPRSSAALCCGMAFGSKGLAQADDYKNQELLTALMEASEGGKWPILCETSPCVLHIRDAIKGCSSSEYAPLAFALYEPVSFVSNFLKPRLQWTQVRDSVMLHVPCSTKKLKLHTDMTSIAQRCAKTVVDSNVSCCGMAGDRGMRYPELPDSAGKPLARSLGAAQPRPSHGYSASRTCELQMSNQAAMEFSSLLHLVNEATTAKA